MPLYSMVWSCDNWNQWEGKAILQLMLIYVPGRLFLWQLKPSWRRGIATAYGIIFIWMLRSCDNWYQWEVKVLLQLMLSYAPGWSVPVTIEDIVKKRWRYSWWHHLLIDVMFLWHLNPMWRKGLSADVIIYVHERMVLWQWQLLQAKIVLQLIVSHVPGRMILWKLKSIWSKGIPTAIITWAFPLWSYLIGKERFCVTNYTGPYGMSLDDTVLWVTISDPFNTGWHGLCPLTIDRYTVVLVSNYCI
jgi:hypothetical protein